MQVISFIGTPEEFKEVAHLFVGNSISSTSAPPIATPSGDIDPSPSNAISRVLKRIPISKAQQSVYQALYEAGDTGLTQNELAAKIQHTEQELSGVLGALGRRINNTEGIIVKPDESPIEVFFNIQLRDDYWHYTMRPTLKQVLEQEGLVKASKH